MGYHAFGELGTHARRPIPRYNRGISCQRRVNPVPSLADDIDFLHRAQWGLEHLDDDREAFTCPDWIDQTRSPLSAFGRLLGDDAEPDDEDTGVDDEPHDPREEDGL